MQTLVRSFAAVTGEMLKLVAVLYKLACKSKKKKKELDNCRKGGLSYHHQQLTILASGV